MNQVKALGLHQAGDDAEERRRRIFLEPEQFLQPGFVLDFSLETANRIIGEQGRVRQRVIDIRIDTVDNPKQPVAPPRQHAVEFLAPVTGLYFARIARADGCDEIRVLQPALEEICHAVELQRRGRRLVMLQIEHIPQDSLREYSLILEIMNRTDRFHGRTPRRPAIMRTQQDGNHADMPVVAMEDVRRPAQSRDNVQDGFAEKAEPLRFVIKIIEALAAEIVFIVDKIDRHPFVLQLEQSAILATPAQLDRFRGNLAHLTAIRFRNIAV